jgi:hypothetical protein
MRPTTLIGLAALTVVGIMVADFLIHPTGTAAAGNAVAAVIKPTEGALLGVAPS